MEKIEALLKSKVSGTAGTAGAGALLAQIWRDSADSLQGLDWKHAVFAGLVAIFLFIQQSPADRKAAKQAISAGEELSETVLSGRSDTATDG